MDAVLDKLAEVFSGVFDDDELVLSRQTTAADIEGWDSLMHVRLMVNVEKAFGIRFTSTEVAAMKNVGELVDMINKRLQTS